MRVRAPLHSIDVRGRFGMGPVFSIWRGLNYARSLVIPVNPQSVRQLLIRGFLSGLSRAWALLTDDQRQSWEDYADLQNRKNVFGQDLKTSGINEYIALGVIAEDTEEGAVSDPPVTENPPLVGGLAFAEGALSGEIAATWTGSDGDYVDIWITKQLGAGRKAYPTDYRHDSYTAIAGGTLTISGLVAGGKYALKGRAVRTSGQVGPYQSATLTAKV